MRGLLDKGKVNNLNRLERMYGNQYVYMLWISGDTRKPYPKLFKSSKFWRVP